MVNSSSKAGYQSWGQEDIQKNDLGRGPAALQVLPLYVHPSVCTPALHALTCGESATGSKLNNCLQVHQNITENLTCLDRSGQTFNPAFIVSLQRNGARLLLSSCL